MILFTTTLEDGVEVGYVKLSHEEEYKFARWVMDVLTLLWIDTRPTFHEFMLRLFKRKRNGKDIEFENFVELQNYLEQYEELLPPFPKITENEKYIRAPTSLETSEERETYITREIIRAWKEVWASHPRIRESCAPVFMSGDTITYPEGFEDAQKQREEAFWTEVDAVQDATNWSRQQAIQEVSDYMIRAQDNYKLSDPAKRQDI